MLNRIVAVAVLWSLGNLLGIQQAIAAPICADPLTEIMPQMLTDLPSYSNRVIQRSRRLAREEDTFSYILVANQVEFEPIPLSTRQFTPTVPDTTQQIFFTTLEKQYTNVSAVTFQNHYWLFLTPTTTGLAIAQLVSNTSNSNFLQLPDSPRDATHSVIAEAIKLWLRDYNAHCPFLS